MLCKINYERKAVIPSLFALRKSSLSTDNLNKNSLQRKRLTAIMKDSILRTKSKEFAKYIVLLCRKMKSAQIEYSLINQLLRSATSVGANIHEAQYAQGTKDFVSKLEIALKECNESDYWIELLYETESMSETDFHQCKSYITELRRMLVSSVTTIKNKQN